MKVLFAASEAVPFAKTGGLADVAGSLPTALQEKKMHVRLAMPLYRGITGLEYADDFPVRINRWVRTAVFKKRRLPKGVRVYFGGNYGYFDREELYGYNDDPERFIFFSKAVLEMIKRLNWKPDIIHCHDWHTGLIPVYLKTVLAGDPFYAGIKTVFTLHNLQYQGICSSGYMRTAGLGENVEVFDDGLVLQFDPEHPLFGLVVLRLDEVEAHGVGCGGVPFTQQGQYATRHPEAA